MKHKNITNPFGMEFVYIEPGTFMMGSPEDEPGRDNNETQHQVTLTQGYYMQTTPVTQGQWEVVMGINPSYYSNCGSDCPVEHLSWNDAQEFIRKLNRQEGKDLYRLPTEAQWEYSARAGTTTPFYFGRCLYTDQANYNGKYPLPDCPQGEYREKTTPVKMFQANAWGLYDMHGNVWEWVADGYGTYPSSAVIDPTGPASVNDRVLRGGGYQDFASYCRSASRFYSYLGDRSKHDGFRLVLLPGH